MYTSQLLKDWKCFDLQAYSEVRRSEICVHSEIKCGHYVILQYISLYTYISKDHIGFSHIQRYDWKGSKRCSRPHLGAFFYIEILKEEGKNYQSAPPPRERKCPSAPPLRPPPLKGVVSTCLVISAVRKQPMKPVLSHSNRLLSFYHGNVPNWVQKQT